MAFNVDWDLWCHMALCHNEFNIIHLWDQYKILHMPRQLYCHGLCKSFVRTQQYEIKLQKIYISFEFELYSKHPKRQQSLTDIYVCPHITSFVLTRVKFSLKLELCPEVLFRPWGFFVAYNVSVVHQLFENAFDAYNVTIFICQVRGTVQIECDPN